MKLTSDEKHFIQEHAADDLNRLLLAASRYPGVNVPFLVDQIAALSGSECAVFGRPDCGAQAVEG